MAGRAVFISYRRTDSAGHTGRLYDSLVERLGSERVFMDLGMEAGLDFVDQIEQAIQACGVMLVVIGPSWLTAADEHGRRRLDDPGDYVRKEVFLGLRRDIRVVPVLVNKASMPPQRELPDDIAELARRHAHELSDSHWSENVRALLSVIRRDLRRTPAWLTARNATAAAGTTALVAVIGALMATGTLGGGGGDDGGGDGDGNEPGGDDPPALVSLGAATGPDGIAFDGSGALVVAQSRTGELARIDRVEGTADPARVRIGRNPDSIVAEPDAVWVSVTGEDAVARVDPETLDAERFPVGDAPEGIALDDEHVWVANTRDRSVTHLTRPGLEREDIPLPANPVDAVAGVPGIVWLSLPNRGAVARISVRPQDEPLQEIDIDGRPRGVAKGRDGRIWVADYENARVIRIGPERNGTRSQQTVPVGRGPIGVTIADGLVWVANSQAGTVSVIDEATLEPLGSPLEVGRRPLSIAVTGDAAWVTNYEDGTVSRLDVPDR